MIGKIKKGSGFKGCVNYVLGKEQAVFASCGWGSDREQERYNPQLLYADRNESRLEKAGWTYCTKLFGSGRTQIDRREDGTALRRSICVK